MFHCLFKSILRGRRYTSASLPPHKLQFLENVSSIILSTRYLSSEAKEHSFAVSYLITKCGFSPESALSASRYVHFETPDKPNAVLVFFKSHGFSETQIRSLVKRLPLVLLCDTEKTLLPKLEFFYSKGVSNTELAKILSSAPALLKRSLDNQIIPSFDFYKVLLKSDEKTIASIKRFAHILIYDVKTYVKHNINILRESGVPESNISTLVEYQPRSLMTNTKYFKEIVEQVKEMGFNPLRLKFVLAVYALRTMSKDTWERKFEVYKKWGWSEEEILEAFRRHPWCIMSSEKKIMGIMDFFVNELGIESSQIVKRPSLISLSLEKRILPRGSVAQVLLSKGLVKKGFNLSRFFETTEKVFIENFVDCYKEEAPQLLKLYEEKLKLAS